MSFKLFTILFGSAVLILFMLLKFLKGDVKIFVKRTNYYLLGTALSFALLGLIWGLLIHAKTWSVTTSAWVFQLACLGLGILNAWLMFEVLPWPNRSLARLEWLFALLMMAVGGLAFFQTCIYFEKAKRDLDVAFADNIVGGVILFLVPLLCMKLYEMWQAIPRVTVTGWHLPLDMRPPVIEPGKSVKLTFLVHASYNAGQLIQIDILAPIERTVGETFHYIIFRHNVEKNAYNKIEVAENNSRQKAYTWLFFRRFKFLWFWTTKRYLKPDYRIRQFEFQNGEMIYVERVRHWLNDK